MLLSWLRPNLFGQLFGRPPLCSSQRARIIACVVHPMRTAQATLELQFEHQIEVDLPTGALLTPDGERRPFSGWIELASAIEDWRHSTMPTGTRSTMVQSDAEILRTGYDAFARGDVPAVLAVFSDGITIHIPGEHQVSGDFSGQQEVVAFFEKLGQLSEGTFSVTANEIFDNATGTVVALCTLSAERSGRQASFDTVQVWRFADGKATSMREFNEQQAALDEFWS